MIHQGFIEVTGGKVWYKVVGEGSRPPLLLLHGGPGFTHISMEPLAALADERPVVFYDQLGSGNSDRPDNVSLWNLERFVEELGIIRTSLNLYEVHILGHSWGTMLASAYLGTKPEGVKSLILSSPCLEASRWSRDQDAYKRQLPLELQDVLSRCEQQNRTDAEEYQQAMHEYYIRHYCRLEPWPDILNKDFEQANMRVYQTMWGPAEFYATGNLKEFDGTPYLREIHTPTLFTCGRFDESTPDSNTYYSRIVQGSELHVFENSGHMSYLEETDEYLNVVRAFLAKHD